MAIKYGFFNSVGGDRKYNAEDMTKYFDKIVSDGVFNDPSDALRVLPSTGMTIRIRPGRGLISCRWLENTTDYNLTLDGAHVTLNRIDRIVMRLNLNESARNMELAIVKGTPATDPAIPSTSTDALIKELTLARVYVAAGATEITTSDITDLRSNATYCGWVRSLVGGSGSGVLRKYQSHQVLTAETSSIQPNIPQYVKGDVMMVFAGGVMMIEGEEYTVDGTGSSAVINLVNTMRAGNPVTCIVLKIE